MGYIRKIVKSFLTGRNVSYLLVNVGNILVMALVSSFLAVYYVNVLGMDEYAVGSMFLVARIFDGINDPLIGYLIDQSEGERLDRFKKTLITGVLLCSVNYLVLWIGPAIAGVKLKLAVAYVSYLLLGITFPIMDISLNSLLPAMTDDKEERGRLSCLKIIGYGIGTALIEAGVPVVLAAGGGDVDSYIILITGITVCIVILSCVGTAGIKKDSKAELIKNERKSQKASYHIKDFLHILSFRNVWSAFISGICFYTGNAALAVSNTYYAVYYLDDIRYLTLITAATYSMEVFVVFLLPYICKKMGNKNVFWLGLVLAGAGIIIRLLPSGRGRGMSAGLLVSSAIFGIGYGFAMILFYSIQAENVDEIYKITGKRTEGAVASLMSMANKLGKGIGGAVPLYVLGMMKRTDGTYTELSLELIDGVIPAVLMAMGGIIFLICYTSDNYSFKMKYRKGEK